MCTLCNACTEKSVCYCARCPFNTCKAWPTLLEEACFVCGEKNCKAVYCGFAVHAQSSGKGECLECIEEEYGVKFEDWQRCPFTLCLAHKTKKK